MKNRIIVLFFLLLYLTSCERKSNKTPDKIIQKTELFSKSDLKNKSLDELKIMRNEFYARKGYIFKNKGLREYFSKKEWYKPKKNAIIIFSDIEKQNVELIKSIELSKKEQKKSISNTIVENKYIDTVYIDYKKNKKLLDILASYPKTDMGSWDWSKAERVEMVDFIKKNNYVIDTTEMYLNINYVTPNTFRTTVVDGSWTFSIYEINKQECLVIIDDIVGDGNSISTYFYKNDTFTEVEYTKIFGDIDKHLLLNNSVKCIDYLADNFITFDYDFSDKDVFTLSSWSIDQKEGSDCVKGNTIEYKWNKATKSFIIEKIYWKND